MSIRQAQLTDLPYLYDICLKTGLNGGDATEALRDPYMVGQYFAAPYLFFEPEACFVYDIDNKPAGYIIGTSDTRAFNDWFNAQWIPQLRQKYPYCAGQSALEHFLYDIIHQDVITSDFTDQYPSHLHIDLLPSCQGRGVGKQLIEKYIETMKAQQVSGVHLGVSLENERACRFYEKLGFHEIERTDGASFMGMDLRHQG